MNTETGVGDRRTICVVQCAAQDVRKTVWRALRQRAGRAFERRDRFE